MIQRETWSRECRHSWLREVKRLRRMVAPVAWLLAGAIGVPAEPVPERTVVLTFDDSVKSHFTVVRPLLKELGFSATFFITEGFDFLTNKDDYMTWEEIRTLSDDGFEIGNHTKDHLGVTSLTLDRLVEQIERINNQCLAYGIPRPISFAYPGNAYVVEALPILAAQGFRFARRGGAPEYDYAEGGGMPYEPGRDHPLLIPSVGDARPNWSLFDFEMALSRGGKGAIPVVQFHGVPDRQHPWVHTPPQRFREYMQFLKDQGYTVLALRDLERFGAAEVGLDAAQQWIADRVTRLRQERSRTRWPDPAGSRVPTFEVIHESLEAVLRDNAESPAQLSGIQSLFHRSGAPDFDAFDPDSPGASAGLNFEHIISGHRGRWNQFSPRHGFAPLFRAPDGQEGVLQRHAEHDPWGVASRLTYALRSENAVDFSFQCQATRREPFGERGYAVFFFANYMNDMADVALHFRGVNGPGQEERWIRADAPEGPADYQGGGTYRSREALPLAYDENHNFKLNLWSYDYPRFTEPFYYGKAAHGMVFILMFDRACGIDDEIRISLFKFKIPRFPRPALDFQYVIHRVDPERLYGFRGRLVWKPFVDEEDCRREYLRWISEGRG